VSDNTFELSKKVYGKGSYTNIIDTSFKQLLPPEPEDTDTVENLFRLYDKLFFIIDKEGETLSHRYLVNKSKGYIDTNIVVPITASVTQSITIPKTELIDHPLLYKNLVKNSSAEEGISSWNVVQGILRVGKYNTTDFGGDILKIDSDSITNTRKTNLTIDEIKRSNKYYSDLTTGENFFTSFKPTDEGILTTAYQEIDLTPLSELINNPNIKLEGKELSTSQSIDINNTSQEINIPQVIKLFYADFFAWFGTTTIKQTGNIFGGPSQNTFTYFTNDTVEVKLDFIDKNGSSIYTITIQNFKAVSNESSAYASVPGLRFFNNTIDKPYIILYSGFSTIKPARGFNDIELYKQFDSNSQDFNIIIDTSKIKPLIIPSRYDGVFNKDAAKVRIELKFKRREQALRERNVTDSRACQATIDNINFRIFPVFVTGSVDVTTTTSTLQGAVSTISIYGIEKNLPSNIVSIPLDTQAGAELGITVVGVNENNAPPGPPVGGSRGGTNPVPPRQQVQRPR
jgi:hypothetical protein